MLETLSKEMAVAEEETEMNRVASLTKFRDEFQDRCHTAASRNISRVPPLLTHEPTAHAMHTHMCRENVSQYTRHHNTHNNTHMCMSLKLTLTCTLFLPSHWHMHTIRTKWRSRYIHSGERRGGTGRRSRRKR